MTKFRIYYNKDKETEWLNEMAEAGYAMTGFFAGFYTFEECEPGEYKYQIDFTQEFGSVHSNYREFMRETGVEIVGIWGFWVVLRRKVAEGEFRLYTDTESMIAHYNKIRKMFKIAAAVEMICLFMEACAFKETGNQTAGVYTFVISVVVFVLIREVVRLNKILAELKSRLGQYDRCGTAGGQGPARMVLAGLLIINSVNLLNDRHEAWLIVPVLLAVILLAAGAVLTFLRRD